MAMHKGCVRIRGRKGGPPRLPDRFGFAPVPTAPLVYALHFNHASLKKIFLGFCYLRYCFLSYILTCVCFLKRIPLWFHVPFPLLLLCRLLFLLGQLCRYGAPLLDNAAAGIDGRSSMLSNGQTNSRSQAPPTPSSMLGSTLVGGGCTPGGGKPTAPSTHACLQTFKAYFK